ncbi:MAG TPA: hypothetical protein VFM82_07855 [Flavobacteriaceae bacterium]|nr:hypothetical protein [Flavobacteriaceae bacterium]
MNDIQTLEIQLDFGTFQIHENYVLSTIFKNVLVGEKRKQEVIVLAKKYFPQKNFGYISDRVNNHSTKLTNFLNLEKIQNLKGIAAVCYSPLQIRAALLEKEICLVPFEIFDSLEKAKIWINSVV